MSDVLQGRTPKAQEWGGRFAELKQRFPEMSRESAKDAADRLLSEVPNEIPFREAAKELRESLKRAFPPDSLIVIGADELARMDLPPRGFLLEPILHEKTLTLLYGLRGIGKTLISVGMALAIAAGTKFLRWTAPTQRRVLYVDGELPIETLKDRIVDVARSMGIEPPANLRLLTPDQQGSVRIPNLAEVQGQKLLEEQIDGEGAEFVVLDNLSVLCRSGEENDSESWQVIQDWLVVLRSRRVSVLLDHHAGKSGDQRGTSKREDVLDLSIRLSRPADYHPEQGARFEVEFKKTRGIHGTAAAPFEARLEGDSWSWKSLSAVRDQRIVELSKEGLTCREIGKEVGLNPSNVSRALRRMDEKRGES